MSVWDMDSEESDMSSDDEKKDTPKEDDAVNVELVEKMDALDTEDMVLKRSTFCD